jgi:hypothetical protein
MNLKLKVNKRDEAEEFFRACSKAIEMTRPTGKPDPKWQQWLEAYKQARMKS